MKGDQFIDSKNNDDNPTASATPNMFSKLHHHHHHQHPLHHHHHHQQHPFSRHFPLSSDEDSASHTPSSIPPTNNETTAPKLNPHTTTPPTSDGATIEVVRRPRGRPPGSKNKPKPPVIITRDQEPSMSPYILEVPSGTDIVEAISLFCRRKNVSLCVLSGSGAVSHFTLRNPTAHAPHAPHGAAVTFHGRFDILWISATFMAPTMSVPVPSGVAVSLSGPQGQIIGGTLAGPLVAAGPVYVVAATLSNPSCHRLSVDEDARNSVSGGSAGEGQSPPLSGGGESGQPPPHAAESGGVPMYSCHLPSDVIWAPSARQQAPY